MLFRSVMELIGLSPMGTAAVPQVDPRKYDVSRYCGAVIMDGVKKDRRPRQIVTRTAIENAVAGVAATGGSTNAVLHLLAIAREAAVPLEIDDFQRISNRTPILVWLSDHAGFDPFSAGDNLFPRKRLRQGLQPEAWPPHWRASCCLNA